MIKELKLRLVGPSVPVNRDRGSFFMVHISYFTPDVILSQIQGRCCAPALCKNGYE